MSSLSISLSQCTILYRRVSILFIWIRSSSDVLVTRVPSASLHVSVCVSVAEPVDASPGFRLRRVHLCHSFINTPSPHSAQREGCFWIFRICSWIVFFFLSIAHLNLGFHFNLVLSWSFHPLIILLFFSLFFTTLFLCLCQIWLFLHTFCRQRPSFLSFFFILHMYIYDPNPPVWHCNRFSYCQSLGCFIRYCCWTYICYMCLCAFLNETVKKSQLISYRMLFAFSNSNLHLKTISPNNTTCKHQRLISSSGKNACLGSWKVI